MIFYITRRLIWTAVVILAVVAVTFAVFFLLPNGNPALRFCGKSPSQECLTLTTQRLHLDKPWYVEFGYFVKN
ncbi:MAG: ABC transporter permease, partial [Actinobacteria bacterium]